jgi:hypothetical protein
MLGIIISTPPINYMAIITMQGRQGNIRKCPCIARSVLSGHVIACYSSPLNRKHTIKPWWHPLLPLLATISPLFVQFNPPKFKNISVNLQCQQWFTQTCHRCSRFFSISHCVTDTRDHEIQQSDHFDCLTFIKYCLRHSYTATHDLWLYHRSICDRYWLIGACILV